MIRKDDTVIVIAGKDKGKKGKVLRVLAEESRAVVEKINIVKRHTKPTAERKQGGIIEKEASIHISNLMLLDPKDNKPTRHGWKLDGGKKTRIARRSGAAV